MWVDVWVDVYSAARLTRHTGYGNAAGLLAARGVMGIPKDSVKAPDFSSDSGLTDYNDEDDDTDVNPVTGRYI